MRNDMHVRVSGQGPTLLFVHGLGCSGAFWADVVVRFEGSFTCVAVDLQGFGESPALGDSMSIADWASRLEGLLDGLAAGPAVVIGHSLGGMVTQELALAAPYAVRGVGLCNTIPRATEQVRQIDQSLLDIVHKDGSAVLAEMMAAGLFGPVTHEGTARARARFLEDCSGTDPRSLELGLRAIMAFDALDRLGGVQIPALVVTGEFEGNMADQEVLAAALPDATLVVMAGTGHMAPAEDPATFAEALHMFVAGLG
jgi:pimeloyl-ACP methyl ester carboxylesterase